MATGIVLCQGDRTSCGGRIVVGSALGSAFGKPIAKEGDPVTCGKDGNTYKIIGGISLFTDGANNRRVAGSLDSYSSCPCKAKIRPSNAYPIYEKEESKAFRNVGLAAVAPLSASLTSDAYSEPEQHAQTAKKKTGIDAGFAILPYGGTTEAWQRLLFTENPPAGAKELFATLNGPDEKYKAGSIMLLVDPKKQDDEQIAHMQAAKQRIDTALEPLTHKEANFLHKHYATIANFSIIADKGIGLAADPVGKYFDNIEKILKEIQGTYKNTYMTRGALIGEQFYVRRAQLFTELDRVLKVGFLNKTMKLGEYTKIKNALGLSTSSITHKWNETGISDIEGYATHIERAAKYAKAMRYAGYVGIAFSAVHSINEINEACSTGREAECTKKKYTEIGSFSGGLAGGLAGGALGMGICSLVLGTATMAAGGAGALACGVILGTSAGYVGGEVSSSGGEAVGEFIYSSVGQ
ncbi:PAAR domain-containing protein [Enterobacter cloacae]|uniref:PAAR domain-containing protein n=1 Tax=Enterobacter cloacae TaxID=550 RepID=UPI001E631829|nr:PAAR domain-containing protein [Enterobacter cloacae]MCE1397580.1 PAAR domain-containing protein [Enterobacter cloacae]